MFRNLWKQIKASTLSVQEMLLCLLRKWWRPVAHWIIVGGLGINVVFLPYKNDTPVSLTDLAALCVALFPFIAMRGWEKTKEKE